VLSLLAQFANVEAVLVAPLGGNEEGRAVLQDLENEGVITKYCKIWRDAGVPSAWVLHSGLCFSIQIVFIYLTLQ
jgi:sugar/nucleoside kinase (ribokinase family)